tara:strand:- start:5593 stop:5754 length:162 start_codon:yes stop_codon:yes gene_type:complete
MSYNRTYEAGWNAYHAKKSKEANPYGAVKIKERCWWSAGWHDAKNGYTKKAPQ